MADSVSNIAWKRPSTLALHLVVAASLVMVLDRWSFQVLDLAIGASWVATTQVKLLAYGCPGWLVSGVVSACLQLPGWVILASIAFVLGLCRSDSARRLAWMLSMGVPLANGGGGVRHAPLPMCSLSAPSVP